MSDAVVTCETTSHDCEDVLCDRASRLKPKTKVEQKLQKGFMPTLHVEGMEAPRQVQSCSWRCGCVVAVTHLACSKRFHRII